MKKIFLILIALILIPSLAHPTGYFVKNGGDNAKSGLDDANAWETIAKVVTGPGGGWQNGDTINLKRGSTWTDATLTIPSVDNFTIQDYGTGAKPFLNGDSNQPIRYGDWSAYTGTADGNTTNHLIDSGASFQTDGVSVGHIVVQPGPSALGRQGLVTAVNSETDLTLSLDAFPNGNENYEIYGDVTGSYKIITGLTIKNIDISGQDFNLGKDGNIYLFAIDGLTIDGVIGDGHYGGNAVGQTGNQAIIFLYSTGTIEIKNCDLYNWGKDPIVQSGDVQGITPFRSIQATIYIHDNTIHDVTGDGILPYYWSEDGTTMDISGNTLWNFSEQAIDVKGAGNINISGNSFYTKETFDGGGSPGGGTPTLITIANSTTFTPNSGITIYDNKFGGSNTGAMIIEAPNSDIKVYNNWIEDTAGLIWFTSVGTNTDIDVYNNVMLNPRQRELGGLQVGGVYFNTQGTVNFYNNTIIDDDGDAKWLLYAYGGTYNIKNNIFYMAGSQVDDYAMNIGGGGTKNISYNNVYSASSIWILQSSNEYGSGDQAAWRSAGHAGSVFGDPLLEDISNKQLWPGTNSPAIDVGIDLGVTYDDGLHKDSSWEKPVSIINADQDEYGDEWEIGAYVNLGAVVTIASSGSPSEDGLTSGTFTISVTDDGSGANISAEWVLQYIGSGGWGVDIEQAGTSMIVSFASPGVTTFTVLQDSFIEGDEFAGFNLITPGGVTYEVGSPSGATLTITDNDTEPPEGVETIFMGGINLSGSGEFIYGTGSGKTRAGN